MSRLMHRGIFYFKGAAWFGLLFLMFFISACQRDHITATISDVPSLPSVTSPGEAPTLPPSPLPPSPTPQPLAARVNGEGITLVEYQAELARFKAASGTELASEDEQRVLDDLIDQVILAQEAARQGFEVNEEMVQEHIDAMIGQLGSSQALTDWMEAQGYDEQSFRLALRRSIAAAWMRDQIIAGVSRNAEQVHARQILLYNSQQAQEVLARLKAGDSFTNLALEYDPLTGGDLGWFPRGYLLDSGLDQVAFSLQPEQYSDVIQTLAGFHILQVLERDPQRPLSPAALLDLQSQALRQWLETRRQETEIERLLP